MTDTATTSHERAIERLLVRYATAVDDRDWELLRSCFTEDLRADYGDIGSWSSAAELTTFMDAAHLGFGTSHHMLSNLVVEVDGDVASARCHVHAVLTLLDDPLVWFDTIGSYADRVVLTADGWRIAERTFRATRLLSGRSDG